MTWPAFLYLFDRSIYQVACWFCVGLYSKKQFTIGAMSLALSAFNVLLNTGFFSPLTKI